jgi:hypothetical protein
MQGISEHVQKSSISDNANITRFLFIKNFNHWIKNLTVLIKRGLNDKSKLSRSRCQ